MLGEEIALLERQAGAENVEAWELMQRASDLQEQAGALMETGDIDGAMQRILAADSLLAAAEEMAPEWVEPTVQRGWLDYRNSRFTGFEDRSAADRWIGEGMVHAETAVRLDSTNSEAMELRATLQYWRYLLNLGGGEADRLVGRAEADYRESVRQNPQQASAWSSLSHLLANQDRLAEAKVAASRSYEADPYLRNAHLTLWRLFYISFDLGDGVESRRWCEEGRRRFPDRPRFRQCGLMVQWLPDSQPDIDLAWQLADEFVALSSPGDSTFNRHKGLVLVALVLARAGETDSARVVAERARAGPDIDPTRNVAYWEAILRSMIGDMDEAVVQWNVHAAANPDVTLDEGIWYVEALRQDPRLGAQ
jgi:tetratricopeptide (TPR) repeat protein